MPAFCGQERCLMDENGRIRLSSRFLADLIAANCTEVVLHGLPEGAIALYPESVYREMRQTAREEVERAAVSLAVRRSMRRFGALTEPQALTRQGRITVPPLLREYAALTPGRELCLVGVEIGLEIWNCDRYAAEMATIREHWTRRGEREMLADLAAADTNGGLS